MDNLDSFAPSVDIQAEMDAAPQTPEVVAETPAPEPESVSHETPETSTPETPAPEQRVVPIAALSEARKQAKEMKQRLEEAERNNAAAIAELNARLERLANPPAPEPSFDENPAENLRQRQERIEREQKAWADERAQHAKAQEAQMRQQQAISYVSTEMEKAETEFSTKTPDYMNAVDYLRQVSEKNLKAQGVTDPVRIKQITYEQSFNMAMNAIQQGLNPAEVAYQFAKNYGYSHKVDATKQVKAMAEAQGRTQNMGTGKPETEFSIAALSQMDDTEFEEAIANDKVWAKIVKG